MFTVMYILLFLGAPDGWAPNPMGEYQNKAACENAREVIKSKLPNTVCVPKWINK